MLHSLPTRACWPSLLLPIFLSACGSSPDLPAEPGDEPSRVSVWDFLRDKYDLDQDGFVTAFEYQPSRADLRSLDSDGDGQLSAADFEDNAIFSSFDRSRRAQFSLLEYFQDDDEPLNLTRRECKSAAQRYDANGDGSISKLEFRALKQERLINLMAPDWMENPPAAAPRAPWVELRAGIDVDRDRGLSMAEIERFFMDNSGGRGIWNAERYIGFPLKPGFESLSGPRLGAEAPDFTLQSSSGKESITLSSFRGERPVALIFGSYT